MVAAVEEERFRRIKHWAGFPTQSIAYCLREAGVSLRDVDHIALNQDSSAHFGRKLLYLLKRRPDPRFVLQRLTNRRKRSSARDLLAAAFPGDEFRGQLHNIEHHL